MSTKPKHQKTAQDRLEEAQERFERAQRELWLAEEAITPPEDMARIAKSKLEPCPFCGSPNIRMWWQSDCDMFVVECDNEDCRVGLNIPYEDDMPKREQLEDLVDRWNTRVGDAE